MPLLVALALIGFFASAVVHLSTFFTDRLAMNRGTWILDLGVLLVWLPAVMVQASAEADAKRDGKAGQQPGGTDSQRAGAGHTPEGDEILQYAPRWMVALAAFCFVYALVNFVVFIFLMREGAPRIQDGQYLLMQKSRVVRPLSAEEFHRRNRYETRGFSGHSMLFYSAAAAILYARVRQRKAERAERAAPVTPVGPSGARSYTLYPRPLLSRWAHRNPRRPGGTA